ncbi:DsbA family oxidoreductase [Brevibacillus laterosporus]|uniref:DsbA family oxidoreductase n=1 Tax=Brevibacillus laterosporus TaxID=1465 RepID=UPI000CE3CCAA|nr:DsbA family oxidoreductase [Brevibacillus laterosporus]MED1663348.1 DsbA family oxidoreductase [Brevibacillus laterosporus]MED1671541.1 DsbA family oxidoreductase [Brevibacillus laterosporus]MED1720866.1 DsbA family oxidoreductase [Brevibacillus laterosporus]PPA82794.1 protein-disulfide isomerase [Brevibacillus laterosporus]
MKVEVWSDFACPFCYIGKQRIEAALDKFAHKDDVEVVFRSFELDPKAQRDVDYDVHDMLVAKYGMSRDQAIAMNENLSDKAKEVGLTFQFDTLILTNTFDAHRLAKYAFKQGKMNPMAQELFRAYFTDSRHLGDHETLVELAVKVGLDRDEALRVLAGDDYSAEVRADEEEASRLGVSGVPFFVIDRKYAVSGAQSTDMFLNALQRAWKESQSLNVLGDAGSESE